MSASMIIHVTAGTFGMLSGVTALFAQKGSRLHRAAGNIFFLSMLITAAVGASIAFAKPEMITAIAGVYTAYMIATAWMTVIREEGKIGLFEYGALPVALAVGGAGLVFGLQAMNSETGLKDGFSAEPYFFFASLALLAAALDVTVIARGGLSGAQRIARHLWRMCFGLFIATGSFFAQTQVFPKALRESGLLGVPELLVIAIMAFWLIRVLFTKWHASQARVTANKSTNTEAAAP